MDWVIRFLNILLPVLYVSCLFLYGFLFVHAGAWQGRRCRLLLRSTLGIHLLYLALVALACGRLPMTNLYEALSFLAFAIAAVYAYLEQRVKDESAGVFILAFVFLFQILSSAFVTHESHLSPMLQGWGFALHVVLALLSYAALAISAVFSAMYLMLYYEIKRHRFGLIYSRLPSLDVLGTLCYQGARVGFVLLTLAIFSGVVWSHQVLSVAWYKDAKGIVALVTWLVYGVLLVLKSRWRWHGLRVAYFSLAGFAVILFSLMVVNLFLTGFHGFS